MRASTKPDGSTETTTVSQPGVICHAARGEGRAAVTGALGKRGKADAEMAALGARLLLPRAEGGQVDRLRPPFPASACSSPRRTPGRSQRCRGICRSGCGGGCRRGRGSKAAAALSISRSSANVIDRPRHAAIRRHGAGVGGDAACAALVGAHVVGAGQFRHGHQRLDAAGCREAGIGADIGDDVGLQRQQLAVRRSKAPSSAMVCSRLWKPAIRFSRRSSVQATERFQLLRASHTSRTYSGASDIFCPKPPPTSGATTRRSDFRHADSVGDRGARQMRHLRGAGQRDAAGRRIVGGMAGARFHRRGVLPARARFDLDDLGRARSRTPSKLGGLDAAFDDDIARHIGMDSSGAPASAPRCASVSGAISLMAERNLIGEVLGRRRARRHHRRHRLADKAHGVGRQNRLADRLVVELVQHRQDRLDTFQVWRR